VKFSNLNRGIVGATGTCVAGAGAGAAKSIVPAANSKTKVQSFFIATSPIET
jgi:hypothetical protein